jgi:hypothetical protein
VSENLDELLHDADGTLLANFAAGLRRDFALVEQHATAGGVVNVVLARFSRDNFNDSGVDAQASYAGSRKKAARFPSAMTTPQPNNTAAHRAWRPAQPACRYRLVRGQDGQVASPPECRSIPACFSPDNEASECDGSARRGV